MQLCNLSQICLAFGLPFFDLGRFDLFLDRAQRHDGGLLQLPVRAQSTRLFLQVRQFFFQFSQAFFAGFVLFLLQRLTFDLQLHDLTIDFVQRRRLGIDLHAQARSRFIDQVDGLVGQLPIGDVALAQSRRSNHGSVLNPHAVMHFVAFL